MYSVGRAQKMGCMPTNPTAARHSPAMATTGVPLKMPEMAMRIAVTIIRLTRMRWCLRVRSASPGK